MTSQKIKRQSCSLQYILAQTLRSKTRFPGTNSKFIRNPAHGLLKAMSKPTYFEYQICSSAPNLRQQEWAGSWDVTNVLSQLSTALFNNGCTS